MYDPTIGRWLTPDPSGFTAGDVNLYRAEGNEPTSTTDPTGLEDARDVDNDARFNDYLRRILKAPPTADQTRIGSRGCIGLCQLGLGLDPTKQVLPQMAANTLCFEVLKPAADLTMTQLNGLIAKAKDELAPNGTPTGKYLRLFIVQHPGYVAGKALDEYIKENGYTPLATKPLMKEGPPIVGDWFAQIDPRTIDLGGSGRFDFSLLFQYFAKNADRSFFLHMNHSRSELGAKAKRSTLAEVLGQPFNSGGATTICVQLSDMPNKWYNEDGTENENPSKP